jgi:hypothetical protein
VPIVFGWVIGVFVGAILALATLTGAGLPISGALVAALGAVLGTILTPVLALAAALAQLLSFILIPLAGLLLTLINVLIPNLPIAIGPLIIALFLFAGAILIGIADLIGYVFASRSIAPFLPGLIAPTPLVIPTGGLVPPPNGIPPSGVSVAVSPSTGESFIRGVLIGISSAANAVFVRHSCGGMGTCRRSLCLEFLGHCSPRGDQSFLSRFPWLVRVAVSPRLHCDTCRPGTVHSQPAVCPRGGSSIWITISRQNRFHDGRD